MPQRPFALSVKALVIGETQQVLVLRRSARSKHNAGLWDLPGGKWEPGEPMDVTLVREVAEETGLNVRLTRVVGATQVELDDRVVAYLIAEAEKVDGLLQLSPKHDAFEWRSPHKLAELVLPEQFREFLKQYASEARQTRVRLPFDPTWYEEQIEAYRAAYPVYERLAKHLTRRLEEVAHSLGLRYIAQARAKKIASFAEKIMRPGRTYPDPLRNLTDLCGARVICHTLGGVKAVSRAIEKVFTIFPEHSGDKLDNLAASEFGYRSQHYIVGIPLGDLDLSGLTVPDLPAELELKAEVQVRTILQHAWADINHEVSYKNRFKLPFEWQRELARLAAVLEEADRSFESIGVGLAEYASSYDAYYTETQLVEEMAKLEVVRRADSQQPASAHQLARMAILKGHWTRAVEVLTPFQDNGPASLLRDLGVSLCKLHGKNPEGPEFARGQALLEEAVQRDPTDVDAPASLGGTWRKRASAASDPAHKPDYHARAKKWYQQAFTIDPTHPYSVGNYIEYAIADHHDAREVADFFQPSLQAASTRCRKQAEVGVNLPWASFDLGKFQLLLHNPYEALRFYAKGVEESTAAFFLDSALASFPILAAARFEGQEWSLAFLKLAKAIRFAEFDADLPQPTPGAPRLSAPVVIVAGYAGEPAAPEHRALLIEAFRGFRGTIISGGTTAGISGLVGTLQVTYPAPAIHTIGYVPGRLPPDVTLDARYAEHRTTAGTDFSPLEPLQYWADLHGSEIPAATVRLLVLGGGRITAIECLLALVFGASVGVVASHGAEVDRCLAEPHWLAHDRLKLLPAEAGAVARFLGA